MRLLHVVEICVVPDDVPYAVKQAGGGGGVVVVVIFGQEHLHTKSHIGGP